MSFWRLDQPSAATAIVCGKDRRMTYGELRESSDLFSESLDLRGKKTLGFLLCRNSPECLIAYLGALRSGQAVCLLDADLQTELLNNLLDCYLPDWIFTPEPRPLAGYAQTEVQNGHLYRQAAVVSAHPVAAGLALLLPTSGSTGSPKLVRLTLQSLQANAESIVSYLGITEDERGLTSLPMSYSYGLSILNTHLHAGATLLMNSSSFLQREYWDFIAQHKPTSLAGVPYHYEVMLRMRMLEKNLPGLRTLTQAGGRLDPAHIAQIEKLSADRGWRFFVMYGQTEATARISYVPPERLREKLGSIGIAIPGGSLSLDNETSELLYAGPNVMLGYANERSDLAKGDELCGRLRTGDLARQDEEGYYYIIGRLKRFLKVYGRRFSLDEIEVLIKRHGVGSAVCFGTDDRIRIALDKSGNEQLVYELLKDVLKIHPNAFRILKIDSLPRLSNGKVDYQSLAKLEAT